jgi:hypothetical protein
MTSIAMIISDFTFIYGFPELEVANPEHSWITLGLYYYAYIPQISLYLR